MNLYYAAAASPVPMKISLTMIGIFRKRHIKMKYSKLFFAAALAAIALSCAKETQNEFPSDAAQSITQITAGFAEEQSKTVLKDDGVSVLWNPQDEINVFFNSSSVKFTSINTTPDEWVIFQSDKALIFGGNESSGKSSIWGVYPYSSENKYDGTCVTLTVPSTQSAVEGSFGRGTFPSVGRSQTTDIAFYNVCGGIRFSLCQSGIRKLRISGNNNETVAGKVKVKFGESGMPEVSEVVDGANTITLSAPEGGEFQTGKWYYVSLLPVKFSGGFSFEFIKRTDESERGFKSFTSSREVKRSIFGSIEDIDSGVVFGTSITGLEFSPSDVLVAPMSTLQLPLKILPSDATYEWIEWTSSDNAIATVDENGTVTGQKDGKCTVTATSDNGKSATCTVYVSQEPISTLDATEIRCAKATLGATFNVTDAASVKKSAYFLYSDTESTLEGLIANGTKATAYISSYFIIRPKGLKAGTKHSYVAVLTFSGQTIYGEVKDFTTLDLPDDALELGLSVAWHQCNLGASRPEEDGKYFAFADVEGKTWTGEYWSGGGFSTTYTYETDDWDNLKPEYDAAHVILGGTSRIPTHAEHQELIDNCTKTWTDNYAGTGVAGVIFTSNVTGYTDKSIFLPASGYGNGYQRYYAGSEGHYWSSSVYSPLVYSSGDTPHSLFVGSYEGEITVWTSTGHFYYGFSVRPVSE